MSEGVGQRPKSSRVGAWGVTTPNIPSLPSALLAVHRLPSFPRALTLVVLVLSGHVA